MSRKWTRSTRITGRTNGRRAKPMEGPEATQQLSLQFDFAPARNVSAAPRKRLERAQANPQSADKSISAIANRTPDVASMSSSPSNDSTNPESSDAFLRLPAVKARTGLSRSTIYDRIDKGAFPPPVRLGGKAVGWPASDIDAWIVSTVAQGRKAAG